MAKNITPASANTVRSFVLANPKEGIVVKESRGKMPQAAIDYFHESNPGQVYTPGFKDENKVTLSVTKTLSNGKTRKQKVEVTVSEARALAGEAAGQRGLLSPKALVAASEAYAKA